MVFLQEGTDLQALGSVYPCSTPRLAAELLSYGRGLWTCPALGSVSKVQSLCHSIFIGLSR